MSRTAVWNAFAVMTIAPCIGLAYADETTSTEQNDRLSNESGVSSVDAVEEPRDRRQLYDAVSDIHERRDLIRHELNAQRDAWPEDHWAHEWAGEYSVGDGMGMNVRILLAPEAGVAYTWRGCMGLYDGNFGDVVEVLDLDADGIADGLKIDWTLQFKSRYRFTSEKYYFVRWPGPAGEDGRRYFVPEERMLDMVNNYNNGGFARRRMFSAPLKCDSISGDCVRPYGSEPSVVGVPQMPDAWAKLLHEEPVDAVVTSVAPSKIRNVRDFAQIAQTRIALDKGYADGLYLGLQCTFGLERGVLASLTIDKVEEHAAEASYQAHFQPDKEVLIPTVGETIRVIGSEIPHRSRTDGEENETSLRPVREQHQ